MNFFQIYSQRTILEGRFLIERIEKFKILIRTLKFDTRLQFLIPILVYLYIFLSFVWSLWSFTLFFPGVAINAKEKIIESVFHNFNLNFSFEKTWKIHFTRLVVQFPSGCATTLKTNLSCIFFFFYQSIYLRGWVNVSVQCPENEDFIFFFSPLFILYTTI